MKSFYGKNPKENPKKETNCTSPVSDKDRDCDSSIDDFQDLFSVLESVNGGVFEGWCRLADGHKALGLSVNEVAKLAGVISNWDVYEEKIGKFVYSSFSEVISIEDDIKKSTIFRCIEFLAKDSSCGKLAQENLGQKQETSKKDLSSEFDEKRKNRSGDDSIKGQEKIDKKDKDFQELNKSANSNNKEVTVKISSEDKKYHEIASVKNNVLSLLKRQKKALHYEELDALYFIEYGNKVSTPGFIRNSEDSIEVFPGVFIHSKSLSNEYNNQLLEEKSRIVKYITSRLKSDNYSITVKKLVNEYLEMNESRWLTGMAVASAVKTVVLNNETFLLDGERVRLRSCLKPKQRTNCEQDIKVGAGSKKENDNFQFEKGDVSIEIVRKLNRKTQSSDAIVAGEISPLSTNFDPSEKEVSEGGKKSTEFLRKLMRSDKPECYLSEKHWSEWAKALEGSSLIKQKLGDFSRKLKMLCPVSYEDKIIEEFLSMPYAKICEIGCWETKKTVIMIVATAFCLLEKGEAKQNSVYSSMPIETKENKKIQRIEMDQKLNIDELISKKFVDTYMNEMPHLNINQDIWVDWRYILKYKNKMEDSKISKISKRLKLYFPEYYDNLTIRDVIDKKFKDVIKEYDYETLRTIIISIAFMAEISKSVNNIKKDDAKDCVKIQEYPLNSKTPKKEGVNKQKSFVCESPVSGNEDPDDNISSEKILVEAEGNDGLCQPTNWTSILNSKILNYDYLLQFDEPWLHIDSNTWSEWTELASVRCSPYLRTDAFAKRLGLAWPLGRAGRALKHYFEFDLKDLDRIIYLKKRKTIFMEVAFFAFNECETMCDFRDRSTQNNKISDSSVNQQNRSFSTQVSNAVKNHRAFSGVEEERPIKEEAKKGIGGLLGDILSDFDF